MKQLAVGESCKEAKPAKIVVVSPLHGPDAAAGLGIRNAVDFAVRRANNECRVGGWRLEVDGRHEGSADDTVRLAAEIARMPNVLGVIGTATTASAPALAGAMAAAGIPMLSPANGADELTRPATGQGRPFPTFFRLVARDAAQAPFAADHMRDDLKAGSVAVLTDGAPRSTRLAEGFESRFKERGGTVVTKQSVPAAGGDVQPLLATLQAQRFDAVFYAGGAEAAAGLRSRMPAIGLTTRLMGLDTLCEPSYPARTKQAGEGDICTAPAAPADRLPDGDEFAELYRVAGFKESYGAYGALAFDAANVLIDAATGALAGREAIDGEARSALVTRVQQSEHDGVTGPVRFDEFGDDREVVVSVFRAEGGKWVPTRTAPVGPDDDKG